jgi:CheY-like chemotaxis protein
MSSTHASILIVDDEEMNRDILSRRLLKEGYSVATAQGGNEALDMLRAQRYDLVLLDIMMPGVDGYEVLRRIKSEPIFNDTPVIMVTALGDESTIRRCLEMGAADYIGKPFELTYLKSRIQAVPALNGTRGTHLVRDDATTVLVVDDDELNRDLLVRRLKKAGHVAHVTATGEEALEMLARQPYDLVLLDIMMSRMDGFQTLQRIREQPALADLPVIMVSALSDSVCVARCMELGANDYITKPFNAAVLKERVLELLSRTGRAPHDRGH